jgi:hypothetical protein
MRTTPLPSLRELEPLRMVARCAICGRLTFEDELCLLESESFTCMSRHGIRIPRTTH